MNRFMGMMSASEVEIQKRFKVGAMQLTVTIQAGKEGWSIIYADGSSKYADESGTSEENFDKAFVELQSNFYDINPL